jgi:uncharacterized protein DUF6288
MNPRRTSQILAGLLFVFSVGASTHAQAVSIPGADFRGRKLKAEQGLTGPRWKTWGESKLVSLRPGSDGDDHLALRLSAGAGVGRRVALKALEGPTKKDKVDPAVFDSLITVDVGRRGRKKARLLLRLRAAGKNGRVVAEASAPVDAKGLDQRLRLVVPASATPPGTWWLEVEATEGSVLIDNLRWARLPRTREGMLFAKSNGPHGPDRVESAALGFVGWSADGVAALPVFEVRADSPAARAGLRPGDVVVGVAGRNLPRNSCRPGWEWFERGHEATLARAALDARRSYEDAKPEGHGPRLSLEILRGGQSQVLKLELDRRGALPPAFPFDEGLTADLYDDLISRVRQGRRKDGRWAEGGIDWIQTSFAGLALLGRRDPADAQAIRETADWFLKKFAHPEDFGNLGYWAAGYAGIFMCEYLMATGDDRVRPWIENSLAWVRDGFHTSKWGTLALGHGPDGLPYGNKALMAPASHVIVFEALAREAGIESGVWERLMPYMEHSWSDPRKAKGHGAMGYNGSYRDLQEFWSRSGLFALACTLRGERGFMKRSIVKVMRERHPWMRNSHAYGNPGDVWGLVGLAAADRAAFSVVMRSWRVLIDGAWSKGQGLRHSTAHMGSPYMGEEGLINPAWAMLLSLRHRGLAITGAPRGRRRWLDLDASLGKPSPVVAERDDKGRVRLRPAVPGLKIYWSRGHLDPRKAGVGQLFEKPISLPEGGRIAACSCDAAGQFSRPQKFDFGLPEVGWRILAANGDSNPERARRRAGALIDEDPRRPWTPDLGEGASKLPLRATIDFGRREGFGGLLFRGRHRPARIAMRWASSAKKLEAAELVEIVASAGKPRGRFALESLVTARYLEIEIREMEPKAKLRIGELDLWRPEAIFRREGALVHLDVAPQTGGLVLQWEQPSSGEGAAWAEAPASAPFEKVRWRLFRVVDAEGRVVGPHRRFPN